MNSEACLIPLNGDRGAGLFAKVSPEDYESLSRFNWNYHNGYAARGPLLPLGETKSVRMHRQILNPPPHLSVDHINHDRLDNRRENLRLCTPAENSMNSTGKNVAFRAGAWDASIYLSDKRTHLGRYPTEEEATRARDAACLYHYGEFANVTYPDVEPRSATEIAKSAPSQKAKAKSGFHGVGQVRRGKKHYWAATYGSKHIGYFPTALDAARAYDARAYEALGPKASLNFPDDFPNLPGVSLPPKKPSNHSPQPIEVCEICEFLPSLVDGLCRPCLMAGLGALEIERDQHVDMVANEAKWINEMLALI